MLLAPLGRACPPGFESNRMEGLNGSGDISLNRPLPDASRPLYLFPSSAWEHPPEALLLLNDCIPCKVRVLDIGYIDR